MTSTTIGRRGRLLGVDAARGFAILGMFYAHVAPLDRASPLILRGADRILDAATAPLFAVLAGVSVGLMSDWVGSAPGRSRAGFARQIAIRALLIILIGLLLTLCGSQVAIVLPCIGTAMLLLIPFVWARAPVLLASAAVLLIALPPIIGWLRDVQLAQPLGPLGPAAPLGAVLDIVFTGYYYQAAVFLICQLVGLAILRIGLSILRAQLGLVAAGALMLLVGYGIGGILGFDASPDTGTSWEILAAVGWSVLAVGTLCAVAESTRGTPRKAVRAVLSPVAATGTMPLTIYSAQILVLGAWAALHAGERDDSWPMLIALSLGSLIFAALWVRLVGQGPLEWVVARISGRPRTRGATAAAGWTR